jgi:hypothetical protein
MKSPRTRPDASLLPLDPSSRQPLSPRNQPGYYPGFSTLAQRKFWDAATRALIERRVELPPQRKFFSQDDFDFWTAVFAHLIPQSDRTPDRQVPLVPFLDERLAQNKSVGYRFEDMPHDRDVYSLGIEAINLESEHRFGAKFQLLPYRDRELVLKAIHDAKPKAARHIWRKMSIEHFWQMLLGDAIDAYYAHPWAWDEIGFGGPAYPRAYTRLERGEPEPWEVEERRYTWDPPAESASHEVDPTAGDRAGHHHGSGGTH